jgi:hypothetical protein
VSASVAARLTAAAGAASVAEQTAAVEALEPRPTPAPAGPAGLQVRGAGALRARVGQPWGAGKTRAIGTLHQEAAGTARARALADCSGRVEPYRRGVGTALAVVAGMDGADGRQRCSDGHRPAAIRGLDCPHAVEDLTRARHAAHGAGPAAPSAWLATPAHTRTHAGPDRVLLARRALPAAAQRATALGELEPRLAQRQSPTGRAAG